MPRFQRIFATLASGLKLHYRISGHEGPWLVCLNGLLSDLTLWSGTLPELSKKHRVLCFDFLGQGASDFLGEEPCTPGMLAEQAWELMQLLNVDRDRPWLLGLSNGSNTALELLASRSQAFSGAVLCSCMAGIDFANRLKIQHWIDCLKVGGPLLQFDASAPYLWGDRFLEARYGLLRAFQHKLLEKETKHFAGALAHMEGLLNWEMGGRLAQIQAKVLLLAGAEDLLTPPWKCLETAKRISKSRLEVIPHVGHAFPVEDANSYALRVVEFIDSYN